MYFTNKKIKIKDIEILYEKFFIISKYRPLLNSNVNTVISDINNIESSTNSDGRNEIYNINNNNRNNIVNNSRISDSKNYNIVTDNVVNSSIGENCINFFFNF